MNLMLIGYRGTGKTTVARILASRLGWNWTDTDQQIEEKAGKSIADIFQQQGEQAFRDLEARQVQQLRQLDQTVIALGGGAVLRPDNREVLRSAVVVWLVAEARTLWERISQDRSTAQRRPKLTASDDFDEIRELLRLRAPVYARCADYKVNTDDKTPQQIADEIVALLENEPRWADQGKTGSG